MDLNDKKEFEGESRQNNRDKEANQVNNKDQAPPVLRENIKGGYSNQPAPGPAPDKKHDNPNAVDHAALGGNPQPFRDSGRNDGLVNAPIQSIHPTSQKQGGDVDAWGEKKNFKIIDNVNLALGKDEQKFAYPFVDLEIGQGIFIPVEQNGTTDQLVAAVHRQVDAFRKYASSVEHDENGDEVMERVIIKEKKRNDDGTIQLSGNEIRTGANQTSREKLIGPNFAVKAVVKGDAIAEGNEAEGDGVLVVRMA